MLLFFEYTAQKMKFLIKDFFSKCGQIHRKLRIWSHLLKKFLMENFIFCGSIRTMKIFLEENKYRPFYKQAVTNYSHHTFFSFFEYKICLRWDAMEMALSKKKPLPIFMRNVSYFFH